MTALVAHLRYACRTLRRSPWFTALAVLILAAGIGLNTALFSMVDAVLLNALPFKDPDRLVEIWGRDQTRTGMRVPPPLLDALHQGSRTLEAIAIHGPVAGTLRTSEGPVDIRGRRVSANFVQVMGIPPAIGRGFLPEEGQAGMPAVMIVSHGFWQRFLSGDTGVVGRTVYLDSIPHTVVGIMPREFRTSFRGALSFRGVIPDEFWTTYVNERTRELERESGYEVTARLAPGASIDEARREAAGIAASVDVVGWGPTGRQLGMRRIIDDIVGDSARALKLLLAAVAVVLAIVCANLALLLLSRSDARLREFATRKAMGASVSRLLGLALAESVLLSLAGAALGAALAYWLLPTLLALAPSEIPRIAESTVGSRVLVVTALASIVTACAFGLAPALRLSRLSVAEAIKGSPRQPGLENASLRSVLVVGQVGASVVLCVLAGLVGQTFLTLLPSEPGFESQSLVTVPISLPPRVYPSETLRRRRLEGIARQIESAPGVSGVAIASNIPFSGDDWTTSVRDVGGPESSDIAALRRAVSANYFAVLRIPVLRGRVFAAADGPDGLLVAVVNQRLASQLAPSGGVLGSVVRIGRSATAPTCQIVGVVADGRSSGSNTEILPEIYVPSAQSAPTFTWLVLRTDLSPDQASKVVSTAVRSVAPELPLLATPTAMTMEDRISGSLAGPRFLAVLAAGFSGIALLLSALGVFALVAYSVSQRRREFGVRAALGARPRDLSLMTLRWAIALMVAGVLAGLACAAYLAQFVEKQLYAIEPLDPPTFMGVAVLMLVIGGVAAAIPAVQATRWDPVVVLREI